MNIVVFSLRTVPDVGLGRRLMGNPEEMAQLSDKDVAKVMWLKQDQNLQQQAEHLDLHLQKIIALSMLHRTGEGFCIETYALPDDSEEEMLSRFFAMLHFNPTVLSWDANQFELPLIQYRSLLYPLNASVYWKHYHTGVHQHPALGERHIALSPVFSCYQQKNAPPLEEIAAMLGLPILSSLSQEQIWKHYLRQDMVAVRNDCELDALRIYCIYMRFQRLRGELSDTAYEIECQSMQKVLKSTGQTHFQEYLAHWQNKTLKVGE